MEIYEDINHEGNSSKYHTGKKCIGWEDCNCNNPAGTKWGLYWCFECNVKRMKHLDKRFDDLQKHFEKLNGEKE
jgi:hypothetical protein